MQVEDRMWTERHRPSSLDEVIGHEEIVDRLKQWVGEEDCPHLLLHGPAGTGKTATVVGFSKDKFGKFHKSNLIEMNASDERGIDVVREQIKDFASEAPAGPFSYKIIYLDEADNLTKDAQQALRRTMETYSDQTKFFLSCNYPSKLIDPIQSRCVSLPFHRLDNNEIKELLTGILEEEGIDYDEEAVCRIIEYCDGDARRAVHSLQTSEEDGKLTTDVLDIVNTAVDQETLDEVISHAAEGRVDEAQSMVVTDVVPEVTDYSRLCKTLMSTLESTNALPDNVKFYAMSQVGEMERNILEGCNPHVQINSFVARIPVIRYMDIPNYE